MYVYELAKKLEMTEKEVMSWLKENGFEVKGRLSVVDIKALTALRQKKTEPKKETVAVKTKKVVAKPKEQSSPKKIKEAKPKKVEKLKLPVKKVVIKTKKPIREAVVVEEKPKKLEKPVTETKKLKEEILLKPAIVKSEPKVVKEEPKKTIIAQEVIAKPEIVSEKKALKILEVRLPITLKDLAVKMMQKPSEIIKILLGKGKFVTINQSLDEVTATEAAKHFGYELKDLPTLEESVLAFHKEDKSRLRPRQPVVTFMGHVDHGKTSLLDAIRNSKVAEKEHGGITQHIGAYQVVLNKGKITFLDTPGHEAFTAMRARGANITDLVVLVVAADDGIMPQTEEAIDHSRAAGVPIIVAINKIDKPGADIEKVKRQLSKLDITAEDWGGKTVMVGVSAKTGEGIDNLLEMILLEAEMLELKADYDKLASGVVVEAKLSKGRGAVATVLVQSGTLKLTDTILCGQYYGNIKAMLDDHGIATKEAIPAVPVEVLGLNGVPKAGEQFFVVANEKEAREIASEREHKVRTGEVASIKRVTLDDISRQVKEGVVKEMAVILKADVQGSLEALRDEIKKIDNKEVSVKITRVAVGPVNNSDVILAEASGAVIIGFNVDVDPMAKETAEKEGVDIRVYHIIYEAINEIKQALEGLLEPKVKEKFVGKVVIKQVFKLTKSGLIAGCLVEKGSINRHVNVRVKRNGAEIFTGKLSSLKRFKDDVRDVQEGYECGVAIAGFTDYMPGDIIEAFEVEKIARKL